MAIHLFSMVGDFCFECAECGGDFVDSLVVIGWDCVRSVETVGKRDACMRVCVGVCVGSVCVSYIFISFLNSNFKHLTFL